MARNLKVEVEVEEIISYAYKTGNDNARDEIVHTKEGHQECYGTSNHRRSTTRNKYEIEISMVHSSSRALKNKLPGKCVIKRDGDKECTCGRNLVRHAKEFCYDPQKYQIERKC